MSSIALGDFFSTILGVFAMGTSCGAGCSPIIGIFLTAYAMEYDGDFKKTLWDFFKFFLGKAIAICLVVTTVCVSKELFVSDKGYFDKYNTDYIMPIFLIIMGSYMLVDKLRKRNCKTCNSCGHKIVGKATIAGGFLYGITPCAPLIFLAGCGVTLPLGKALILALIFSMACVISPLLILIIFAKLIVKNMKEEVPKMLEIVRVVISVVLIIYGSASIVKSFI